jgi:hypothetical protein
MSNDITPAPVCRVCRLHVVTRQPVAKERVLDDEDRWCSTLCRRLDIAAARALARYREALTEHAVGRLSDHDLKVERYRLRVAFLLVDERAGLSDEGDRKAFADDLRDGIIVMPPTERGSPEWRARISKARQAPKAA